MFEMQNHPIKKMSRINLKPKQIAFIGDKQLRRATPQNLWAQDVNLVAGTEHNAVRRSLHFMAQNYWRPIQLNDLVVASGMSRRGFLKAFLRHTGTTPGAAMRRTRIERAKRLLTDYDLTLQVIAKRCGFRSDNTFCIAFTKATGMAPKRFQRQFC
jgi:transcriptional regulator GlxA family with amidase domain